MAEVAENIGIWAGPTMECPHFVHQRINSFGASPSDPPTEKAPTKLVGALRDFLKWEVVGQLRLVINRGGSGGAVRSAIQEVDLIAVDFVHRAL